MLDLFKALFRANVEAVRFELDRRIELRTHRVLKRVLPYSGRLRIRVDHLDNTLAAKVADLSSSISLVQRSADEMLFDPLPAEKNLVPLGDIVGSAPAPTGPDPISETEVEKEDRRGSQERLEREAREALDRGARI